MYSQLSLLTVGERKGRERSSDIPMSRASRSSSLFAGTSAMGFWTGGRQPWNWTFEGNPASLLASFADDFLNGLVGMGAPLGACGLQGSHFLQICFWRCSGGNLASGFTASFKGDQNPTPTRVERLLRKANRVLKGDVILTPIRVPPNSEMR